MLASVFVDRIRAGVPCVVNPAEIAQLGWLLPQHIPGPLLPDVAAALEDYAAGRLGVVRTVQRTVNLPPLTEA